MCPLELTLLIQYQPGYHIGYGATEYVYTEYTRSTVYIHHTNYGGLRMNPWMQKSRLRTTYSIRHMLLALLCTSTNTPWYGVAYAHSRNIHYPHSTMVQLSVAVHEQRKNGGQTLAFSGSRSRLTVALGRWWEGFCGTRLVLRGDDSADVVV